MKFNWRMLDELAEEIARTAEVLSSHGKALLKSFAIIALAAFLTIAFVAFWEGREGLRTYVLNAFYKEPPAIIYSWEIVPPTSNSELFRCDVSGSCRADLEKREEVINLLTSLVKDVGALRASFFVYGEGARYLAASVTTRGVRPLGPEIWVVGMEQVTFQEQLTAHLDGKCFRRDIENSVPNSFIKEAAEAYDVKFITACPVINSELRGYVSLDLAHELSSRDEQTLRRYALMILDIVYHGK
jgi:hypothetical protein